MVKSKPNYAEGAKTDSTRIVTTTTDRQIFMDTSHLFTSPALIEKQDSPVKNHINITMPDYVTSDNESIIVEDQALLTGSKERQAKMNIEVKVM